MSETISHLSTKTRITFVGDKTAAREYVGEANKLLFQHRRFMEDGKTASKMRRHFEDSGVTMLSTIVNGREHVTITAPVRGGGEEADRIEELVVPYIRGFAEGSPDDNLDVYFILDWHLRFRGVRKKIRKHLFVENTAEGEELHFTTTTTATPTTTETDMEILYFGSMVQVNMLSGDGGESSAGSQSAKHNGATVHTGTTTGTQDSTWSHDCPPGANQQTITQSGTTITSGSGFKLPSNIYGTPFLGPILFAYDYTQHSVYYTQMIYTRTWQEDLVPPRWSNPTSFNNTGSHFGTESYITHGFINIGAGFESTGGEYVAVAQNSAAALSQGAPWYEKEENGEIVRYAKPARSDVLLAAYFPAADMVLQCIHKGKVIRSSPIPNGVKEYKGREYDLYVPGVEGSPPQCEFGLCTLSKKRLETDPKSESGYAPYARKKG